MTKVKQDLVKDVSTETRESRHEDVREIPPRLEGVALAIIDLFYRNGDVQWLADKVRERGGKVETVNESKANLPPITAPQNQNALSNHSPAVQADHAGKPEATLPQDGPKTNLGEDEDEDAGDPTDETPPKVPAPHVPTKPNPQGMANSKTIKK